MVVNLAGFLAIHALQGGQSYADLDEIADVRTLYSQSGRTVYRIYDVDHPLAQLSEMALGIFGIRLSDSQATISTSGSTRSNPLQKPSLENAAVPLTATAPDWVPAAAGERARR
jgi:hypothetical protein